MEISEDKMLSNQFEGFLKMQNLFLNTACFLEESFETNNINNLGLNTNDINALQKQKYLGKRAEYFMKAYLDQNINYEPLYHSLQIQDDSKTIGELDFLFYDKIKNNWCHLELICKFYVFTGNENQNNIDCWIGPNLKDRLDYKIQKLKNHQLKICQKQEAEKLFKELDVDQDKIKTKICYKAKLFLPIDFKNFVPNHINSKCIRGQYYNFDVFKNLKFSNELFYIPHKHDWICKPETNTQWYSFEKAEQILKPSIQEKRSKMLWRKTKRDEYFEDFVVWW